MFRILEVCFLIAVVGSLVYAAARVHKGPPELILQRIGFLIAVSACILFAAAFVRWYAELDAGDESWTIRLDNAPLWSPPPSPSYSRFQESDSPFGKLPPAETPGVTIARYPILEGMILNLFFYGWCILLFFAVLYFVTRGDKRDFLLHCGVGIWFGLTAAGLAYFAFRIMQPATSETQAKLLEYAGFLGA